MEAAALLCLAALPCLLDARLVPEGEDGFAECNGYFYQGSPPQGFSGPSFAKICQKYNGDKQFATLYNTQDKTPVYSAFTYREGAAGGPGGWLIEPQLDDAGSSLDEATSGNEISNQISGLGGNQALEEDYSSSEYQPGSLFHSAHSTLTNAVPLTSSFKEKWVSDADRFVKESLLPYCENGENLHLIAGAVPSSVKLNDKVSVPEFVWLAACCNVPNAWSAGIVKGTGDLDNLEDITVEELENKYLGGAKLFSNQCGGGAAHPERKATSDASTQTDTEPPGAATGPFFRFVQFLICIVYEILKSVLYLVWFLVKQVCNLVLGRLYWIWTAVTTYIFALCKVLLGIPYDVLRVIGNVICGFVRIINNVFSAVCLVLRLPLRFLSDIASFPYYTLCAIPDVGLEILSGLWGVLALGLNAIFGAFGGSFSVASFAGSSVLQRFVGQSGGYED
ncbi:endonuclease domain-containing 1 protein [Spea bombifrons]|uniref:endonuclease domain-containing 1 protein n=1 Tax=Spea bombifrons TaxID=233779 RepID=UPI00234BD45F|nr:endonuclease domain-containing 1 protein [Spea bombifrons]